MAAKAAPASILCFFLYGEPPRDADEGFLHVETIADRSRLYDWKIRLQAHRDLHQVLMILAGGEEMRAESASQLFKAPALLLVPATVVHAFVFERDTKGYVITLAARSLKDLAKREGRFSHLFDGVGCVQPAETRKLDGAVRGLQREVVWDAPARAIVAGARLVTVLVEAVRALAKHAVAEMPERSPRVALVTEFRDAIEANLRSGWDVARYAKMLRASPTRLRAACLDAQTAHSSRARSLVAGSQAQSDLHEHDGHRDRL